MRDHRLPDASRVIFSASSYASNFLKANPNQEIAAQIFKKEENEKH